MTVTDLYRMCVFPQAHVMPWQGVWPAIDNKSLVLPGAVIIGDVVMEANTSAWFNAVIRGDDGPVRIGAGTNVQDGCVIHVSVERPTLIGRGVTIGHMVHLHACTLEDDTLVGSGAIVLDGARLERESQVAAGALVAPGKVVPSGELWGGVPARKLRDLGSGEIDDIRNNAQWYVHELDAWRQQLEAQQ